MGVRGQVVRWLFSNIIPFLLALFISAPVTMFYSIHSDFGQIVVFLVLFFSFAGVQWFIVKSISSIIDEIKEKRKYQNGIVVDMEDINKRIKAGERPYGTAAPNNISEFKFEEEEAAEEKKIVGEVVEIDGKYYHVKK